MDLSVQVNSIFVPVPVALKSVGLDGAAAFVGCCGGGGGCDVGAVLVAVDATEDVAVAVGVSVATGTVAEGTTVEVEVDVGGTVAARVGVAGTPMVILMGAQAPRPATVQSARKNTLAKRSRDKYIDILLLPG
jgi:hypothetical protein